MTCFIACFTKLFFTECNHLFLTFLRYMSFSVCWWYFWKSILDKCFSARCQVVTIIVFSFYFILFLFHFVVGVRHRFLLTCLLWAFSVWNSLNLVSWKSLNIHYFSWCNQMYRNKSCWDVGLANLGCFCWYIQGDTILGRCRCEGMWVLKRRGSISLFIHNSNN